MLQQIEIGNLVNEDIIGVRVTRTYRGRIFQVTKPYVKLGLVGMKVEDVSNVVLLDLENEFARGFSQEFRAFNAFPTTDQVLDVKAVVEAIVDRLPRDAEMEEQDRKDAEERRKKDAELAEKQVEQASRGAVPETTYDDNQAEW